MPKVLLTGSRGLIGQKILARMSGEEDFNIFTTSRSQDFKNKNPKISYKALDITERASFQKLIKKIQPDFLIHTAAMAQVDECERQKELCWKTNVEAVKTVVESADPQRTHLIHFSTDFVFDGELGLYREQDLPNPPAYYGLSKWESEKIIQSYAGPWTLFRVLLVYGWTPELHRTNIVLWTLENLEKGRTIRVAQDQYRMPTLAEDIAEVVYQSIQKRAVGLYHICGPERLSIFEIAKQTAECFGLPTSLLQPVLTKDLKESAKRPLKTGFVIEKAKHNLDYHPRNLREGLEIVKTQMHESKIQN
ncbi:MAG: SDR family oxidoreductase [Candidatus Omnitrophica bacterium]|nr:SDR family oxidoreductase [Candidatus Omnitrophota bacterium]